MVRRLCIAVAALAVAAFGDARPASALAETPPAAVAAEAVEAPAGPVTARYGAPAVARAEAPPPAATLPAEGANDGGPVLTLTLDKLTAGQDSAPVVRVFVGKPDATADTPVDDPHYVGAASFFPLPPQGPTTVMLPLTEVMQKLEAAGLAVDPQNAPVTVVLAPSRQGFLLEGAEPPSVEVVSAKITMGAP